MSALTALSLLLLQKKRDPSMRQTAPLVSDDPDQSELAKVAAERDRQKALHRERNAHIDELEAHAVHQQDHIRYLSRRCEQAEENATQMHLRVEELSAERDLLVLERDQARAACQESGEAYHRLKAQHAQKAQQAPLGSRCPHCPDEPIDTSTRWGRFWQKFWNPPRSYIPPEYESWQAVREALYENQRLKDRVQELESLLYP